MSSRIRTALFAAAWYLGIANVAQAAQILPVSAQAWPNTRTSTDIPPNAVDGNLTTFTWSTEAFTVTFPCHLGLDFFSSKPVNHLRLWKDDHGGHGTCPDNNTWDLVIQYTTDLGPIEARNWTNVSNLTTGFGGETLLAASVNAGGTVNDESHDSENEGDGWAALTFDTVNATGVRISFSSACVFNHYKVHELEAYDSVVPVELSEFSID